jgi:hypothetical protein
LIVEATMNLAGFSPSPKAAEGTDADFEKALKVGEKLTFEAKDGVLSEVKITGMGKGKGKGKAND